MTTTAPDQQDPQKSINALLDAVEALFEIAADLIDPHDARILEAADAIDYCKFHLGR